MRFERAMSGVEELDLHVRIVTLEGVGPGREKEGIGFPPDRERRRPVSAKILLELGLHLDVAGIVEKQIQLNVLIAGACQQGRI